MSISEYIRQTKREDIQHIIDNVRHDDVVELDALNGLTIEKALDQVHDLEKNSQVWVVEQKPVCIFGVTPLPEDSSIGIIWMLATKDFDKYAMPFAFRCKKVVEQMIKNYEYVYNYIHDKNKLSVKWLKWLGFSFDKPEPIGHKGANFYRFELLNV